MRSAIAAVSSLCAITTRKVGNDQIDSLTTGRSAAVCDIRAAFRLWAECAAFAAESQQLIVSATYIGETPPMVPC